MPARESLSHFNNASASPIAFTRAPRRPVLSAGQVDPGAKRFEGRECRVIGQIGPGAPDGWSTNANCG